MQQHNLRKIQKSLYNINAPLFSIKLQIKKQQLHFMSTQQSFKNYYAVLGVPENASLFEIESAYQKLASKWHPDKHKEHRKSAQIKFQEIAEAFEVLSDRNKRAHYDELLSHEYNLSDANSTFEKFFNEHGLKGEEEEKFFNQNYPNPLNNYYSILGLSKNASLDEIKAAYRKLALQYHPKNNPGNQEANKKFIEVNQAYNALCDEFKRENYDNLVFGTMLPLRAHSIFDDFFGNKWMSLEDDIRPLFKNKLSRNLDNLMIDENEEKNIKNGESIRTSSVYTKKNGEQSKKTVTSKKTYKDGKAEEQKTEEYWFPNGDRNVKKSVTIDGRTETKEYKLKKGEQMPKELTS